MPNFSRYTVSLIHKRTNIFSPIHNETFWGKDGGEEGGGAVYVDGVVGGIGGLTEYQ